MKVLLIITTSLLFLAGCKQKETTEDWQSIYLSPEVMCGTVQFTDGCGSETDTLIRFGLALIHHMTYEDAGYTFDQVIKKDPDCFWGYWGKAMAYIHPLWPDMLTEKEMESGMQLSKKAMALAKNDKEKLYGAALNAFYDPNHKSKPERLAAYQKGLAEATAQLPDDPEAALFNGLFRLGTVSPGDKSFTVQREVGEMAEQYMKTYPDHPGAFHYAIHAYDVPPLATRALAVARSYGKIAPEIPHALHMPSHIFTRLGYWAESIDWNARSAKAAIGLPYNGEVSPHLFHALDYEVYALLQQGNDASAREVVKNIDTLTSRFNVAATSAYALAAMPARLELEVHQWAAAAALPDLDTSRFSWKKFPQWEGLFHYGRGLGAARSGNKAVAEQSLASLTALQTQLGDAPATKYWFDQMEAQKTTINAWLTFADGKKDEALTLMQKAADLEDATVKNPVSPGELLPARELLGDMLMELNKPADAFAAYEACLATRPNRFNSLYGAGAAAEKTGDTQKMNTYYTQLLSIAPASTREQIENAKKALVPG
jgi:tetratricopeptide (TPR) repeat protein